MEPIKLSFVYSQELELQRVVSAAKRIDWYLNHGYRLDWISFPKILDFGKRKIFSEAEVLAAIQAEYDKNIFILAATNLDQLYDPYKTKLALFIRRLGLPIISPIIVTLTRYGMGGGYSLPNSVVVNITQRTEINSLTTTLHEIIHLHLHIQHLIEKHRVTHWSKEALVNLLFGAAFPDLQKKDNQIPREVNIEKVKIIYQSNFPDIEEIILMVGKINAPEPAI